MKALIFIKSIALTLLIILLGLFYILIAFSSDKELSNFLTPFYSFLGKIWNGEGVDLKGKLPWMLQIIIVLWVASLNIFIMISIYQKNYFKSLKEKKDKTKNEKREIKVYVKNKELLWNLLIWFCAIFSSMQLYINWFFNK